MSYRNKIAENTPSYSLKKISELTSNDDLKRLRYCLEVLIEEVENYSSDTMITVPLREIKRLLG